MTVYGTTSIAEIRKIADQIEHLTKEESLDDPGADHARQVWSASGLRELADRRQALEERAPQGPRLDV